MIVLLLLYIIPAYAGSFATIHDIGSPYTVLHESGDLYWLRPGTGYLQVCLAMSWQHPCVAQFEHSRLCPAITPDCKCYTWMSTISDEICADIFYNDSTNTSIVPQWQLMRREGVYAAPSQLALWYGILHARFPTYSFGDYLPAACLLSAATVLPAGCTVAHVINIQRPSVAPPLSQASSFTTTAAIITTVVAAAPLILTYIRFEEDVKHEKSHFR